MQRLFSTFPAGWPGGGLLLLRAAAGLTAMTYGVASLLGQNDRPILLWMGGIVAMAGGFSLLVGLLTPAAGILVGLLGAAIALSWLPPTLAPDDPLSLSFFVVVAIAIVLLGPGAYSLDSYLFGRREIVIPPSEG